MAWTTPKDWAVLEQLTAANMNTHLRDNLAYLKDNKSNLVTVYQYTYETEVTHTGDTNWTLVGAGQEVVLAATSSVIVLASFSNKASNHIPSYQLYRDTTGLGVSVFDWGGEPYSIGACVAYDDSVAAGTYTYGLKMKISDGSSTVYCDQLTLLVIVIPD